MPPPPPLSALRVAIGLVVLCHYPVNHHPARQATEDALHAMGLPGLPPLASVAFTLAFVYGSAALAYGTGDLALVMHLVGGTVTCFIICFLPGLMLMNASVLKRSLSRRGLLQPPPEAATEDGEEDDEEEGRKGRGGEEEGGETGAGGAVRPGRASSAPLDEPLLRACSSVGGESSSLWQAGSLMYSPARSWWAGLLLVLTSIVILVITLVVPDNLAVQSDPLPGC